MVKESGAISIMQMSKNCTITHDDKLLIRGQKSDIGIVQGAHKKLKPVYRDGDPVIVNYGYRSGLKIEWVNQERYYDLIALGVPSDMFLVQPLRGESLSSGSWVEIKGNQVDLYLLNLYKDFNASRYSRALNDVCDLEARGVFKYNPKKLQPTDKNKRDALRHRLIKYLKPREYEHNFLFTGELGGKIYKELREAIESKAKGTSNAVLEDNTIYLRGYKQHKDTRYKSKFYNIAKREGGSGDVYKFESTLLKAFFLGEGITMQNLTEQPKIQELVGGELAKSLKGLLNLLTDNTRGQLAMMLGLEIKNKREQVGLITSKMLKRDFTYTEQIKNLEIKQAKQEIKQAKLEAEQARQKAELERIKKHLQIF